MLTIESALRKDMTNGKADMQHRHFATIATIIREIDKGLIPCSTNATRKFMAELFADELRYTNPRFDRARFLKACGVATD
jgi:hypothetical protein